MAIINDPHADGFREWLADREKAPITGAPQVGDRIRVAATDCSYGDYDIGCTAVVREVDSDGDVSVSWDEPFNGKPAGTGEGRCEFLLRHEFKIIERPARAVSNG